MTIPNLLPAVSAFHPLFIPSRHVLPTTCTRLVDYRFNRVSVCLFSVRKTSPKRGMNRLSNHYTIPVLSYIFRLTLGFDLFILFFENSIQPFRQSVNDPRWVHWRLKCEDCIRRGLEGWCFISRKLFSNLRVWSGCWSRNSSKTNCWSCFPTSFFIFGGKLRINRSICSTKVSAPTNWRLRDVLAFERPKGLGWSHLVGCVQKAPEKLGLFEQGERKKSGC